MSHVKSLEIGTAPHCLNSHAFRCNVKVKVHSITVGWYALRGVYLWSWEGGAWKCFKQKYSSIIFYIQISCMLKQHGALIHANKQTQ